MSIEYNGSIIRKVLYNNAAISTVIYNGETVLSSADQSLTCTVTPSYNTSSSNRNTATNYVVTPSWAHHVHINSASLDKTYGTTIGYIRVNSFSTYESSLEYDYTGSGWNTIGGLTTNVDYSITGGQWLIIEIQAWTNSNVSDSNPNKSISINYYFY